MAPSVTPAVAVGDGVTTWTVSTARVGVGDRESVITVAVSTSVAGVVVPDAVVSMGSVRSTPNRDMTGAPPTSTAASSPGSKRSSPSLRWATAQSRKSSSRDS
ncbi:MAG: hypothetical protein U5J98_01820 [Halobacteriales archaeon]|nr:hypothetical protein [Halobacteriales archaeon]